MWRYFWSRCGLFSKTVYPDVSTGRVILPACINNTAKLSAQWGCRAFLSPWYERGGTYPADDKDTPVLVGRFNIGAVSLHLPMILAKTEPRAEISMRCWISIPRWSVICISVLMNAGQMRASTNPLAYCEGGFYGGHLKPAKKIGNFYEADDSFFRYYSTEWTAGALSMILWMNGTINYWN